MTVKSFQRSNDVAKVILLEEEVNEFPDKLETLEIILKQLNPHLIVEKHQLNKIKAANLSSDQEIIHIAPINAPHLSSFTQMLIIDSGNLWGRFDFLKAYLSIGIFKFEKAYFKELILQRNGFVPMVGKNRILSFLPFLIRRLSKHGYQRFIPIFIWKDSSYSGKFCSPKYCGYYQKPSEFIEKSKRVIKNLSDEKSREAFDVILNRPAEKTWENYFDRIHNMQQYSDYITLDNESVIINCGLDGGTELPFFLNEGVKQIINIDPCGEDRIKPYVKKFIESSNTNIVFVEKALYQTETVYSQKGKFDVTTLTEVVHEQNLERVDLIKSDLEGTELLMVDDLIKIGKRFRTQLAISIYHSNHSPGSFILDDLVDIPLKLMNGLNDYKFYVAIYSYERWEIILYCIPETSTT